MLYENKVFFNEHLSLRIAIFYMYLNKSSLLPLIKAAACTFVCNNIPGGKNAVLKTCKQIFLRNKFINSKVFKSLKQLSLLEKREILRCLFPVWKTLLKNRAQE